MSGQERQFRVGSVSYLNAKPLIYGLEKDPSVLLRLEVPAKLLDGLMADAFDVALLPVIDFQRAADLVIVPSGGIGSDGATLTVRIFSRVPIEKITRLGCDPDSHTSVALARILLAELYGIRPELSAGGSEEAILLIGDKVVRDEPRGMPHQLDLGEAWKRLTGMPFVFAAWTARADNDLGDLPDRLASARRAGLENIDAIVAEHAQKHGWPAALARKYLTEHLKFEVGAREIEAIELFHAMAARHALIQSPARELKIAEL